ncbi:NAD(P)/FAD-dependent oxidoreductase [Actinophytocola sp. KF-1]
MGTDVVVIGGGYAGVMAANRLTRRDDVTVTLINPRTSFVERVRLHQLVGGSDDALVEYGDVLADRVRLVVGTVTGIDAPARVLTLENGGPVGYDYLVYAVGSGSAATPGFAHGTASLEEALRLRSVLDDTPLSAPVTVVGAGPLGIEVAAELGELGRAVTLVGPLGPYLHPRGRRSVAKGLAKLGVTVLDAATVTEVRRDTVRLDDGRVLPSDVTIWTAGFGVPDLARRSGLRTDAVGRLLTDDTLTSVDDDRIVATGDAAAPSAAPMRMSCQAALPLGSHAADTVLSRIAGNEPADFTRGIGAMCVSLGRKEGVFQFARFDDTAIPLHVPGRLGAKLKEAACESPVKQMAAEARKPGSHRWPVKDGKRARRVEERRGAAAAV